MNYVLAEGVAQVLAAQTRNFSLLFIHVILLTQRYQFQIQPVDFFAAPSHLLQNFCFRLKHLYGTGTSLKKIPHFS
jgi:hypothetical protein